MDTYPRLAKELDLAWVPDKSRIVAYNTSNGNVVATLTVKEGLFLSELDGDTDPDDVGEFTQRERFRVLSKLIRRQLHLAYMRTYLNNRLKEIEEEVEAEEAKEAEVKTRDEKFVTALSDLLNKLQNDDTDKNN